MSETQGENISRFELIRGALVTPQGSFVLSEHYAELLASHRALQAERDELVEQRNKLSTDLANKKAWQVDWELEVKEHAKTKHERDALKAELIAWKHSAANEDCLREEIDALKAELVAIENQQGLAEERRQFNRTIDALQAELAEARAIIVVLDEELRRWRQVQP